MKLHRYVDHQRLHIVTKDVISLSISVLLLFRHYISHKITFGAPSSGGVLCSACGAFILEGVFCFVRLEKLMVPTVGSMNLVKHLVKQDKPKNTGKCVVTATDLECLNSLTVLEQQIKIKLKIFPVWLGVEPILNCARSRSTN